MALKKEIVVKTLMRSHVYLYDKHTPKTMLELVNKCFAHIVDNKPEQLQEHDIALAKAGNIRKLEAIQVHPSGQTVCFWHAFPKEVSNEFIHEYLSHQQGKFLGWRLYDLSLESLDLH